VHVQVIESFDQTSNKKFYIFCVFTDLLLRESVATVDVVPEVTSLDVVDQ